MNPSDRHFYEFGPFRLDADERSLWRADRPVQLPPKVLDLLLVLVENRGRLLSKEELLQKVWPDTFVEEANLSVNVSALRRTLGEAAGEAQFIETVARRGYRFTAEVKEVFPDDGGPAEVIVAERTRTSVTVEEVDGAGEPEAGETGAVGLEPKGEGAPRLERRLSAGGRVSRVKVLRLTAAAVLIGSLAAATYWWQQPRAEKVKAGPPHVETLAVLPFRSLKPESGDEYLRVGLADVLITRLSNLHQLVVRPTSSVLPFADRGTDALAAGQALKVDSVLDGSIQQIGDHVRVTVRLVRTSDGQPLWAYQCDEECNDVFRLQDTISEKVAGALALELGGDERERLGRRYTANAEAYQEYLKGRYFTLQFSREGYRKALEHFRRALDLDPSYALAWAGMADAHTTASETWLSPREAMPQAIDAARRALALDDTLGEAHAALGHALFHTWRYREAEPELKRALELGPNAVPTYIWYGEFFAHTDPPRGVELLKRAQELDPASPAVYEFQAYVAAMSNQPELAVSAAQKAYDLDPANGPILLAYARLATGSDYQEAETLLKQSIARERTPFALSYLAIVCARTGRRAGALQLADEVKKMGERQYVSPYNVAAVYAALGEKDLAFAWLEKAYADQSEDIPFLDYDPFMNDLRSDPRLADILRRSGQTP